MRHLCLHTLPTHIPIRAPVIFFYIYFLTCFTSPLSHEGLESRKYICYLYPYLQHLAQNRPSLNVFV